MQHHKYSKQDIEEMIPWEMNIYVAMLARWIEEENKRLSQIKRN